MIHMKTYQNWEALSAKRMQANRILEEEELPFLTSNRICSVLIFSFEASLISFTASSLFLHSEGARGVARIEGSSKGRCEMPPSSWRNIIVMKWQFFSKANTEQDGFSYIPIPNGDISFSFYWRVAGYRLLVYTEQIKTPYPPS